jgi:hypothetical protein
MGNTIDITKKAMMIPVMIFLLFLLFKFIIGLLPPFISSR